MVLMCEKIDLEGLTLKQLVCRTLDALRLLCADIRLMRFEEGCLQVHSIDGIDLPRPGLSPFGACAGAYFCCNVLIQRHADLPPLLLQSIRTQVPISA